MPIGDGRTVLGGQATGYGSGNREEALKWGRIILGSSRPGEDDKHQEYGVLGG